MNITYYSSVGGAVRGPFSITVADEDYQVPRDSLVDETELRPLSYAKDVNNSPAAGTTETSDDTNEGKHIETEH